MNLNQKQVISILLVVLGVLMASTAQLTEIAGPATAKYIVSIAGLANSILAGLLGVLTSQSSTIKDVQAMAGVDKIVVNSQANTTLATLAVDPKQDKIESAPGSVAAIQQTARG